MFYLVKTPWALKKFYPSCIWNFSREEKTVYLTFDDGPHPLATPFVLDALKQYNAKATFFCIGKNAAQYPDIYKRILTEGHSTGNHTFSHLNGSKTINEHYVSDIAEAKKFIDSKLFRPPYGRITNFQVKLVSAAFRIVMWDVLSADFDHTVSADKVVRNVTRNTEGGSIVVFHDSEKAFSKLEKALPACLAYLAEQGFSMEAIR